MFYSKLVSSLISHITIPNCRPDTSVLDFKFQMAYARFSLCTRMDSAADAGNSAVESLCSQDLALGDQILHNHGLGGLTQIVGEPTVALVISTLNNFTC
jgi:hypothetical protein